MGWFGGKAKEEVAPPEPKKLKICCACPETKVFDCLIQSSAVLQYVNPILLPLISENWYQTILVL